MFSSSGRKILKYEIIIVKLTKESRQAPRLALPFSQISNHSEPTWTRFWPGSNEPNPFAVFKVCRLEQRIQRASSNWKIRSALRGCMVNLPFVYRVYRQKGTERPLPINTLGLPQRYYNRLFPRCVREFLVAMYTLMLLPCSRDLEYFIYPEYWPSETTLRRVLISYGNNYRAFDLFGRWRINRVALVAQL